MGIVSSWKNADSTPMAMKVFAVPELSSQMPVESLEMSFSTGTLDETTYCKRM
jgi:hypothetical protein